MQLTLLDHNINFPSPDLALTEPNGLLAIGGDLSIQRVMHAYHSGIFPWYSDHEPIMWWSPNPRAVLFPDHMHVSRSLKKFIKKSDYHVTINHDFVSVITACATAHGETWITPEMLNTYNELHKLGFAHSVEVWQNSELVGGLYGITQGHVFCGESMFSYQANASKIALYAFSQHFTAAGGQLIDCQVLNEHTASLGVIEISRQDYLECLRQLQQQGLTATCWLAQTLAYQ